MGTEIDVFYLLQFASEHTRCAHHLLVRARRPAYANAIQPDEDAAGDGAERARDAIKMDYLESILRPRCAAAHVEKLVGELWRAVTEDDGTDTLAALRPVRPARALEVDFYPEPRRRR